MNKPIKDGMILQWHAFLLDLSPHICGLRPQQVNLDIKCDYIVFFLVTSIGFTTMTKKKKNSVSKQELQELYSSEGMSNNNGLSFKNNFLQAAAIQLSLCVIAIT